MDTGRFPDSVHAIGCKRGSNRKPHGVLVDGPRRLGSACRYELQRLLPLVRRHSTVAFAVMAELCRVSRRARSSDEYAATSRWSRAGERLRRLLATTLVAGFALSACSGAVLPTSTPSPAISVATSGSIATASLGPSQPATPGEGTAAPASPAAIPPGRLAYGRFSPAGTHVFAANTDGTDEQALLSQVAEGPRFSPDGRRLVVVVESPQGLVFSGFVNPDGSNFAWLDSPDPTLNLACASWSPDGSRLGCEAWDDTDVTRQGVYTVRASDGGDLTRVTTSPAGTHDGYCGGTRRMAVSSSSFARICRTRSRQR